MPDELFVRAMAWRLGLGIAFLELVILIMAGYVGLVILFFLRGELSFGLICTFCLICIPAVVFGVPLVLWFGWLRAARWQLRAFMSLWTGLVFLAVLNFVFSLVLRALDAPTIRWLCGPGGPLGGEP
jgi:hypothetical protein